MDLIAVLDKLSTDGVRIEIAFDESSIQRFLLWGILAAVVSGVVLALLKKAIG